MSNHQRPGTRSARIQAGMGKRGHVQLATSVPPQLKDDLVEFCQASGMTMKDAIEAALKLFLYEEATDG